MNRMILSIAAVLCVMALTGCGTVKGMGEDITFLGTVLTGGSDHYKEAVGNNPPGSKMSTKADK